MPPLPAELLPLLVLVGAILAPGKRTVTACLRVMGRGQDSDFSELPSSSEPSPVVGDRGQSVVAPTRTFAPEGQLIVGIDDTIERRRGEKIKAKGIYRDPVRSSHSHLVKASGLRSLALYAFGHCRVGRLRLGFALSDGPPARRSDITPGASADIRG